MNNTETLATSDTQDTGQINTRVNRRDCCSLLIVPSVYSSVYFVLCIRCSLCLCVVRSSLFLLSTLVFIVSFALGMGC
jgi:hypothetical protein